MISEDDAMTGPAKNGARAIAAKWSEVVLVCRKCSKKLDGGFGRKGDVRLEKALKGEFPGKRGPKVLAVPCLDICPKQAVCVVVGGQPGRVHLVARGTPVDEVIAALALTG